MKYLQTKIYWLASCICFTLTLSSCQKSSDPGQSTAKFSASTATYAEDKGLLNIGVTLSSTQAQDVTLQYTWSGANGTYLDGDFKFVTPGSIVVKAGETTGNVQIQIIDDTQVDADDVVTLTLSGTSSNAKASAVAGENTFALMITNNDVAPTDKLQVDLVWGTGTTSVDVVNLDLFAQSGVTVSNSQISSQGSTYTSSKATSGFETLFIDPAAVDQDYYLVVAYTGGSTAVNYTMTLNGLGYSNSSAAQTFAASDSGMATFFGPFTKSGSTFTYTGARRAGTSHNIVARFKVKYVSNQPE
jgi:hypothetical protein